MEEPKIEFNHQLPQRLFATDQFPVARLNVYSKPDTLSFIRTQLEGTPEFETICNSCFGKLFDIPVSRCPYSCKLIHSLLSRQLVTKKKYELWTVFGGQPLRFSLADFGIITGLSCGEFPEGYDPDWQPSVDLGEQSFWKELIGDNPRTTLGDISHLLKSTPQMPSWRKSAPQKIV